MRTREAKHPLHGSAWLQKRGQATIDSQLSEYLQIIRPCSHAKYLLFEANAAFRPICRVFWKEIFILP